MEMITCPICNSSRYKILFSDYNRRDNINCKGSYIQCKKCSHIYLEKRPEWEEIVKFYSSLEPEHTTNAGMADAVKLLNSSKKVVPKWKRILRKIRFRPHSWPTEQIVPQNKRLLDLGCGNGAKLIEFAERGYELWGVDVSRDAVNLCKKLLPDGHFMVSELAKINLPDSYFDYIRIDNALEHVPDPQKVIKECYRLLKKKGELFIYVPHGRSLTMRAMKGNSISSWIPFHIHLFTPKSITMLLKKWGFSDVYIYGYSPLSWIPLSIVQWYTKNKKKRIKGYPKWLDIVCLPFGYLSILLGMQEELITVSIKN